MGHFTVGAWIKPSGFPVAERQTLVGSYGAGSGALPWALVMRQDRSIAFNWQRPDGQWVEVPGIGYGGGLVGQWYYVGAIVETDAMANGTIRVFVDHNLGVPGIGEANLVPFSTVTAHAVSAPAFVADGVTGHSLVFGSGYRGEIDDVFLVQAALASGEVYSLVDQPLACSRPNLVGYWRFDATMVETTPDSGPYCLTAHFGTPVGSGLGYPELRVSDAPVPATSPDCRGAFRTLDTLARSERSIGNLTANHMAEPVVASDGNLTATMFSTGSAIMVSTSDGRGLDWSLPRFVGAGQVANVDLRTQGDSSLFVSGSLIVATWKDGRFDNPSTPQIEYELFVNYSVDGGLSFVGESRMPTGSPIGTTTIRDFSLRGGVDTLGQVNVAIGAAFGPPNLGIGLPDWVGVWRLVPNPTPPPFFIWQPVFPPAFPWSMPRIRDLAFEVFDGRFGLALTVDPDVLSGEPAFDVYVTTSVDGYGEGWLPWQLLDHPNIAMAPGMLAIDLLESSVAVGWTGAPSAGMTQRSLYVSMSNNHGASFGPSTRVGNYLPGINDVEGGDLRLLSNPAPGGLPLLLVAWSDNRWGIDQVYTSLSADGALTFRPEVGYTPIPDPVNPWPAPLPLPWPQPQPPAPWPPCLSCPPPFTGRVANPPRIVMQPRLPGVPDRRGPIVLWTDRAQTSQLKATMPMQGGHFWRQPIVVHEVPTLVDMERFGATFNPRYDNLITVVHHAGMSPNRVRIGGFRGQAVVAEGYALGSSRMRHLFNEPEPLPWRPLPFASAGQVPFLGMILWSLTPGSFVVPTQTGLQDLGIGLDGTLLATLGNPLFLTVFDAGIGATPNLPIAPSSLLGLDLLGVGVTLDSSGQVVGVSDVLDLRVQ